MKKKYFKLLALLTALVLAVAFLPGCGGADDDSVMWEIVEAAAETAGHYAEQLNGEWGDMHEEMIASGAGEDFDGFEEMRGVLSGFAADSDATYIYAMYPSGVVYVEPYFITVDGSEDPDDYGTEYEWEPEMSYAWEGETAATEYVWELDGDLLLSAYAPILNSAGEVVAILGVDYPAPEAEDFPDWIWVEE